MKVVRFLEIAFLSLIIVPDNAPVIEPLSSIFVTTDKIGPFDARSADVPITFIYYSKSNQTNIASFFGVGLNSGNYTYTQSSRARDLIKDVQYDITYNLPLSNYLSSKGMYFYIKFYNYSTNKILFQSEALIYPVSYSYIKPNDYRTIPYISKDLSFQFIESFTYNKHEAFVFDGLLDYVNVDNYYKFSFNNSHFTYEGSNKLTYKNAELVINDVNNCFPYLRKREDDLIHIPIKINKLFSTVSFSFKNSFYINSTTLEVSDTYIDGFVLTNDLYFPVNKKELMDGYIFTIKVEELGMDKISFDYDMKLDLSRNYIGTKGTGDSYVKGGIRL